MADFGYGINFSELYQREGLLKLDNAFIEHLKSGDVALHNRLLVGRADKNAFSEKEHSQLLIDLAPHLEDFVGELFGIKKEILELAQTHHLLAPLYACKRLFIQRRAAKSLSPEDATRVSGDALLGMLPLPPAEDEFFELAFSKVVMGWLQKEEENKSLLEIAGRYGAWALYSEEGKKRHAHGVLFKQPKKLDPINLVAAESELRDGFRFCVLQNHICVNVKVFP
jgi:hypothetical protein